MQLSKTDFLFVIYLNVQAIRGNPIQGGIIQYHNTIGAARQSTKGEQGIVGLNHDVTIKT